MEQQDYYKVGTLSDLVISQSVLQYIDPKRGGSPKKLKNYFETKEEQPVTLPMLRGQIFHKYCENPEEFFISDAVRPSEKLGIVADEVANFISSFDNEEEQFIALDNVEMHILNACRKLEWNKNWKDEAIIKNTMSVAEYLRKLFNPDNKDKIALTAQMKEQIEGCIEGLKSNEYANNLLFRKNDLDDIEFYKEIEFYWEQPIGHHTIKMKAKLDDLEINHTTKTIHINDPKTTGGSAYNFLGSFKSYRLDIQFAVYKLAVLSKFKLNDYKFEYRNIVVETHGLYQCVVYKYHPTIIDGKGYNDLEELLDRVIKAQNTGFKLSSEEMMGNGEIKILQIENFV